MRIQAINSQIYNYQTNFNGTNTYCKCGIAALIAGSSLFMLSNAVDSIKPQTTNSTLSVIDQMASLLSITGTYLGLLGINQDEKDKH